MREAIATGHSPPRWRQILAAFSANRTTSGTSRTGVPLRAMGGIVALIVALAALTALAERPSASPPGGSTPVPLLPLQAFHLRSIPGQPPWTTRPDAHATNAPLFAAVVSQTWPAGLVPVFAVETPDGWEIRRHPPRGRENFTDPLAFVLPRSDEADVERIAGRWEVRADRDPGPPARFGLELAVEGGRVSGRFDQDTDFRFAFVTGGSWTTNAVSLDVEYLQSRYRLEAVWVEGRLAGRWRRDDDTEGGLLEAWRPEPVAQVDTAAPLLPFPGAPHLGRAWPASAAPTARSTP